MFRLAQRSWRNVSNTKKPLYAIKSVDNHTSQKMEVEQFATHSSKAELEAMHSYESEIISSNSEQIEGALPECVAPKY